MSYETMESEDVLHALDGMREELAAASGMLALISAAHVSREFDPADQAGDAAGGLRLIVDRQLYRLEKHYDDITAKFI